MKIDNLILIMEFLVVNKATTEKTVCFFNKENLFKADDEVDVLYLPDDPYLKSSHIYDSMDELYVAYTSILGKNIVNLSGIIKKSICSKNDNINSESLISLDPYQVNGDILIERTSFKISKNESYQVLYKIPASVSLLFRFHISATSHT